MSARRRVAIALEIDEPYSQHQGVLAGILRYARSRSDWDCVIDEHPGASKSAGGPGIRYDGIIARATPSICQRARRAGIPLVNTHYEAIKLGLPSVCLNPTRYAEVVMEHFLDRGFNRVRVLGDFEHKHTSVVNQCMLRLAQQHAVDAASTQCSRILFNDEPGWLKLQRVLKQFVAELVPPTGVLVEDAPVARLVVEACLSQGLLVPQDIAVICKQDIAGILKRSPSITAVADNYERVGYEAGSLLQRLMDGEPSPGKPFLIPPGAIIPRFSTSLRVINDELVAKVVSYIQEKMDLPHTVDSLADRFLVSRRSLQKHFMDAIGRGVSEEIRSIRLSKAKRLLANSDELIGTIAVSVGFSSPKLFNAVFRREFGMTPSEYRKAHLKS